MAPRPPRHAAIEIRRSRYASAPTGEAPGLSLCRVTSGASARGAAMRGDHESGATAPSLKTGRGPCTRISARLPCCC